VVQFTLSTGFPGSWLACCLVIKFEGVAKIRVGCVAALHLSPGYRALFFGSEQVFLTRSFLRLILIVVMDKRLHLIFSRRSVREYTAERIEERDIIALLEAGMAAPSANNRRPWHFVVITEKPRLKKLAEIHPHGQMLNQAALAIAVCGDKTVAPDFWVQDCSAATENILIAAAMLGLGAVWLGVHPREQRENELRTALGIPASVGLLCLIAIGKPKIKPEPRTQFDSSRIHYEQW